MQDAAPLLAKAAAQSRFADLPAESQRAYGQWLLDTFAVMAAGAAHASLAPARAAFVDAGGAGAATALGFAGGVPSAVAALINGAAMTVLQLQDGHRAARGHPMSHVLPAALAMSEELGATQDDLLNAVLAGYEVGTRAGIALGGMQPLLHDTGTFGTIGAAVAAAHLLARTHAPEARAALIETAIGNAAAVALFPFRDTCMEGASTHHLFTGMGAQNGLNAARGAFAGLTAAPRTLERFFGPRAGADFDAGKLGADITPAGVWETSAIHGAYLKWHPVCAHLAPMLDCIAALKAQDGFAAPHIASVTVEVYATALDYDAPTPENDLAARFSFRTAAALALVLPELTPESFTPQVFNRPDIAAMKARIDLRAAADLEARYPAARPARVRLVLDTGRALLAEVDIPRGDSAAALSLAETRTKAEALLTFAWDEAQARAILALFDETDSPLVEQADWLSALAPLLRRPFTAR